MKTQPHTELLSRLTWLLCGCTLLTVFDHVRERGKAQRTDNHNLVALFFFLFF